MKKLTSLILCILIIISSFSCLSFTTASAAATSSQYNIIARANYLWNTVWTCQRDVTGWRYNNTFYKGTTYHLPYGQPVESGQFIGYGVSVNDFLAATKNANSIFYTSKSLYNGWYSTYYANDCSSFVSWCWGTDRHTTQTIPKISTYIGGVNSTNIQQLQIGDALNSISAGHVVLVTGLTYADGKLATIQITEQTPPQMKRTHHTPSSLAANYSSYSIYRYNGYVSQAPTAGVEQPDETEPTESVSIYYPACASTHTSIASALNSIGVDSSFSYRTKIASANGISNYSGSEDQNTKMLNLLKQGLLINPEAGSSSDKPTNLPEINPPLGAFETITTGASSLTLSGWAYDPDDPSALLDINVYIGGDSTSATAEHHIIKADQLREDVGTAYTAGNYHGYNGTVNTDKTGTQEVHLYAGNVGTGHDMYLGYATVNIPEDTTAPEITDAEISDITKNSYKVSCNVKDNSGSVTSVKFASFLATQTIDDAIWYEGTVKDGVASAIIPIDSNGVYNTHIYAYDYKGNSSSVKLTTEINLDTVAPEITNPLISKVTKDSYTVSCNVTDDTAVTSVKFASFHSFKTIEDAVWQEAVIENGVATAVVSVAELGKLNGTYHTHIYAYDEAGNFSVEEVSTNVDVDKDAPVITDVQISDITLDSYKVTCKISDENTITNIKFISTKLTRSSDNTKSIDYTFENGVATAIVPAEGNGTYYLKIHAYDNYDNHSVKELTVIVDVDTTPPLIYDIKISNITNSGYTISCNVADNSQISSVKFPSFHSSKTIDDAIWYEGTVRNGVATATISVKDLGNLNGTYYTHIYAYDINGNYSVEEASAQVITDITGPVITDIKASNINHKGYTVSCKVSDEAGISKVVFPSFHSSQTIDKAIWYEGTVINGVASVTIPVEELGNLNGTYYTHIYAYDIYGNYSVQETSAKVITDITGPEITDINISHTTHKGYTVSCNINDEAEISKVMFPSFHSSKTIDEALWYEGTVKNGVASVTIPVEELGNLNGTYYTHIYAYDIYGNYSVEKTSAKVITDITGPVITDVKISNISHRGYTVSCKVSDEAGISKVKFPSYHSSQTMDDAIWFEGTVENGIATAIISAEELGNFNGTYNTVIYAYDNYDNYSVKGISTELITDANAPVISDAKAFDITSKGFTISCSVTDENEISSVKVLAYHSSQTENDGIWYDANIEKGVASASIPVEDLGKLNGIYYAVVYAYDIYGNCSSHIISADVIVDIFGPEITNIEISKVNSTGYTISCKVADDSQISSVKFPSFHSSKTIEDAIWYEGTIEEGVASVTIPVEELGNLNGTYYTHIYAYDIYENCSTHIISADVIVDIFGPEITNIEISKVNSAGYTISCKVADDSQISNVKFPSFHSSKTIEDAIWYEGTIEEGVASVTIPVEELGNLNGTYYTHIYAYDIYGNCTVKESSAEVVTDINGPAISEITVTDITKTSFTVSCKVSDESGISNLKFLSVHSTLSPEQGVWYEGTIDENGMVTVTIPVEELGNLKGLYNTYIYAYDKYNNESSADVSAEINTELADVNCDKVVDVQDVTAIQDYIADLITLDENQIENADTNGDGKISVRDATIIQLYLAKKITL